MKQVAHLLFISPIQSSIQTEVNRVFLQLYLTRAKWHLQACNDSSRMRPRLGWTMEISIDAAIPTVTDGLVFQILTIWQAIKMSYISLSFHILFIFLSSFCWDICHFFVSFSNVSFSKCQVLQMLQAHEAYTMLLLVKQKNSILPRKISKEEKRITCKLEQAKQPRLNPCRYPWSS